GLVAAHARSAAALAVAEGHGVIEALLLHLLVGHGLESLERAVYAARAGERLAIVAEHLETGDLPGDLALPVIHVILRLVLVREHESDPSMREVEQVDDLERIGARELALDARVDELMVVHHDVVGGRAYRQFAAEARQLDEVGVQDGQVELEDLD